MAEAKPDTPSLSTLEMLPDWQLIRDVRSGTTGMRSAGELYLPKFIDESDAAYKVRVSQTPFTAHYEDACRAIVGKPFSKEVTLQGQQEGEVDLSADAKAWAEDVDLAGNNLHVFAESAFDEAVHLGGVFILVDYPQAGETVTTVADQRATGARPFARLIPIDAMLAVHDESIGGVRRITSARWRDDEIVQDGFDETVVPRVRHMERQEDGTVTLTVYESDGKEWSENTDLSAVLTIPQVPILPFILGRSDKGRYAARPTMLDVAHAQVEHYQHGGRITSIFEMAGFPMLQGEGMDAPTADGPDGGKIPAAVPVGPRAVLFTGAAAGDAKAGKWSYVEPTGTIVDKALDYLATIEQTIRTMALQPSMPSKGMQNMAATTSAVNASRAHSVLQSWAIRLKDALEQMFVLFEMWEGRNDSAVEVYVNTDFATEMLFDSDPQDILSAVSLGYITLETYFDEMMRRGKLGPQFDKAREIKTLQDRGLLAGGEAL
ncbi:DUF4055 domain-containing protein [Ahrensia sp. R2A130]|uniref:DUF4055 domain-containing protein n=1 Tax=Ahrensia sp. R2A130 TaxID=744979 RepID=UPI0001E0BCA4|nr:DUF4055 domain-containing protein [Ahrensia sp. R2A130]EFL88300.1 putative structural phage protein [Ahrensia sp. R2A130]